MAGASFQSGGRTFTLDVWQNSVNYSAGTVNLGYHLYSSGGGGTWYDSYLYATVDGSVIFNRQVSWDDGNFPAADGEVWGTLDVNTRSRNSVGFYLQGYSYEYTTRSASGSVGVTQTTAYTVSYNANGGSGAPGSQTKYLNVGLTLSTTKPTRSGYSFQGWATSSSGGVAYQPGGTYSENTGRTLYAVWAVNEWTVSYNANGGTGAPANQTKVYGTNLKLSTTKPTWANDGGTYTITYDPNGGTCEKESESLTNVTTHTFDNWNTKKAGTGTTYKPGATYSTNAALTLYAQWTTTKVSESTTLPTPTYDVDHVFKGWSTDKNATSGVTGSYSPTKSVTLYAIWDTKTEAKLVLEGCEDISALFKEGQTIKVRGSESGLNDATYTIAYDSVYESETKRLSIWINEEWGSTENKVQDCSKLNLEIYGDGTVIPDLDYICESDNHLWGCSSKARTIYSSALGDPTDFETVEDLSTDYYAVAVGSSDDFTGCCKLSSSVLFFKRHTIHKMLGSYPAEYQLYTYKYDGVSEGNHKSLIDCGGTALYMSEYGVLSYSGSSPTRIGTVLGNVEMNNAGAGFDGERYYMSGTDSAGETHLYIYDTRYGLWMMEDDISIDSFARVGKDVYILSGDEIYKVNTENEITVAENWNITFCPFYETISGTYNSTSHVFEKKRYSRIVLRVELPQGSYLKAEYKTDDGVWHTAGEVYGCGSDVRDILVNTPRVNKLQLRLSGTGPMALLAMEREYSIGSMR